MRPDCFLCPGCGTLWALTPGPPVRSQRVWDETNERWVWVLNATRRWCGPCKIKTPVQRARSRA